MTPTESRPVSQAEHDALAQKIKDAQEAAAAEGRDLTDDEKADFLAQIADNRTRAQQELLPSRVEVRDDGEQTDVVVRSIGSAALYRIPDVPKDDMGGPWSGYAGSTRGR
jgi:acyl-CoA reductase-like NAD-dependent aldehyde dehydrogenase